MSGEPHEPEERPETVSPDEAGGTPSEAADAEPGVGAGDAPPAGGGDEPGSVDPEGPTAEAESDETPADVEPPAPDAPGVTESERAEDTPGEQVSEAEPEEPEAPAPGEPGVTESERAEDTPGGTAQGRRRRRAAEVTTGPRERARPAPARPAAEQVEVRATAKYVRTAPRKARLVVDHIRGRSVDEAVALLTHTPRGAAQDVLKLLRSCVANAENNHGYDADELRIARAYVDEGPTLKRFRPRAQGRATRIRKRTSHMTITLVPKE